MALTLASNAITFTDNTSLSSGIISTPQLSAGSVTTSIIAANSVTFDKISQNSGSFGFRNKIINGDMRISQRIGTTSQVFPTNSFTTRFPLDRWLVELSTGPGGITVAQDYNEVPSQDYYNSMRVDVTAVGGTGGQYCIIDQIIEGYNVRDILVRPFTLSFWVRSTKAGVYNIALQNAGPGNISDRSYITEYTIQNTNTWEYKTITFPRLAPDGGWNWENGRGLEVIFTLSKGDNNTILNQWITGNVIGSPNQVNFLDSTSNKFYLTGVQLEAGTIATPFEYRSFGLEFSLCQRYFLVLESDTALGIGGRVWAGDTNTNYIWSSGTFPVEMRDTPLLSNLSFASNGNNVNWARISSVVLDLTKRGYKIRVNPSEAGPMVLAFNSGIPIPAYLSAEL